MNCYEKLIDECYKENVTVVEKNFKSKAKGLWKNIEAVKAGSKDKYEIADYLNVTDDFFDKAIQYHRLKHGINCICQGVFIYFEPTFGILENR